jgi:hypothetical protein
LSPGCKPAFDRQIDLDHLLHAGGSSSPLVSLRFFSSKRRVEQTCASARACPEVFELLRGLFVGSRMSNQ